MDVRYVLPTPLFGLLRVITPNDFMVLRHFATIFGGELPGVGWGWGREIGCRSDIYTLLSDEKKIEIRGGGKSSDQT
jgi:hypothetical protein